MDSSLGNRICTCTLANKMILARGMMDANCADPVFVPDFAHFHFIGWLIGWLINWFYFALTSFPFFSWKTILDAVFTFVDTENDFRAHRQARFSRIRSVGFPGNIDFRSAQSLVQERGVQSLGPSLVHLMHSYVNIISIEDNGNGTDLHKL